MVMVTPPSVLQASAFSNNLVHASILSHQMHFLLFSEFSFGFYTYFWMMADEIIHKKAYREWH